jgi:GT2 family glycosyltransferase
MSAMRPTVSATIVTYNSERYITRCLETLTAQTYPCLEIIVVDNGSTDCTCALVKGFQASKIIHNHENAGYCRAQNQAITAAAGDWILCVNPDTELQSDCIEQMVRAGELLPSIGIVCPKILRMDPDGRHSDPPVFDSAGGYITPSLRHFDRGSQLLDYGQYDNPEYVFGYTGAITLFRRTMVEDASINGGLLDEDFFYYREDADLSWRTKLLGWRCLYAPSAVGHHVRRVLPSNRRSLPAAINLHSTKNRFLMRINNMTGGVYRKVLLAATLRDLGVLVYVIAFERSSLRGLAWVLKNFRQLWAKRKTVHARRRAREEDLKHWFDNRPVAIALEPVLQDAIAQLRHGFPHTSVRSE